MRMHYTLPVRIAPEIAFIRKPGTPVIWTREDPEATARAVVAIRDRRRRLGMAEIVDTRQ